MAYRRYCDQCGRHFQTRSGPRTTCTTCQPIRSDAPKGGRVAKPLSEDEARQFRAHLVALTGAPLPVKKRNCTNCGHWTAKGCALESFRDCWRPGVASKWTA